jgi:hypothetical protein
MPENIDKIPAQEQEGFPEGYSAVYLPLFDEYDFRKGKNMTEEHALERMNDFLEDLNQQDAEIVSILSLTVTTPPTASTIGKGRKEKKMAIIKRSSD